MIIINKVGREPVFTTVGTYLYNRAPFHKAGLNDGHSLLLLGPSPSGHTTSSEHTALWERWPDSESLGHLGGTFGLAWSPVIIHDTEQAAFSLTNFPSSEYDQDIATQKEGERGRGGGGEGGEGETAIHLLLVL